MMTSIDFNYQIVQARLVLRVFLTAKTRMAKNSKVDDLPR